MVFSNSGLNPQKLVTNIVLGIVAVLILGALLPVAVDSLINMTTSIFAGTVFEPVFANGLVIYGILTAGVVALIFKMLGTKVR